MTEPHETPEFYNSTEYTLTVTFRVAGGARWQTAHRRARRVAERLANAAARAAHVVEVTAVGGASSDGRALSPERVHFSNANSGHARAADPSRLDRYLDPEFDRAMQSLDEANEAARREGTTDRERRKAVSCMNTYRAAGTQRARCLCAYCEPARHERALERAAAGQPDPLVIARCVCGRPVATAGMRCDRHHDLEVVALDSDPSALKRLAMRLRVDPSPPDQRRDGPDLTPPGP